MSNGIAMWFCVVLIPIVVTFGVKIYLKLCTGWCRSQTCLLGKTTIVTGANTGIGYQTALDFAKRGAKVILACRNEEKAEKAREKIIKETDNKNVVVKLINMSSFESVREFAKNINETEERLDILVNNAGVGGVGDQRTKDGQIFTMQVNYYSSFLLTHLLLGLMKKTENGRIVNVSSILGKYAINFTPEKMDEFPGRFMVYNYSKLCNILFTKELAQKLEGTGLTTYSLHPGGVKTEIFRYWRGGLKIVFDIVINLFFKTSEEGAQTSLYCALQKGIEDYNGEHFSDCQKVSPYSCAIVPGVSRKVWELSEKIVQLRPEEKI